MRTLIDANVLAMPQGAKPNTFAKIRMDGANQCPMLTADRLCRIQLELGEGYLSTICATYPRIVQEVGGIRETALTLSCPEAARLVLLDPNLLANELQTVAEANPCSDLRSRRAEWRLRASALFLAYPPDRSGADRQSHLPAVAEAVSAGNPVPPPGFDRQR